MTINNVFHIKFDARTRFFVWVFVFIAIFVVYLQKLYLPRASYLNEIKERYYALENETKRINSEIPDIRGEQEKIQSMKGDYDNRLMQVIKLEKNLPKNINIPEILNLLVKDKDKFKLRIFNIKARNDKLQDIPLYVPPPDSKQKPISYYAILPIEIQMYASFDDTIKYIDSLEKSIAYQRIGSININMQKTLGGNPEVYCAILTVLGRGEEKNIDYGAFQEAMTEVNQVQDPFHKSERPRTEERLAGMELKGIIWKKDTPYAIIDGTMYKVDDTVRGKKILKIDSDSVLLEEEDKLYRLSAKKTTRE